MLFQGLFLKRIFVLSCLTAGVFSLNGCSQVNPFVDARREAGIAKPIGSSTENNPVICYGLFGSQEEIDALAANECAKTGRIAEFVRKDNFTCKLLTPQKAVYKCVETTQEVPPYQPICPAETNN